ncbi:MAG: hypothetical protein IJ946_04245 [Clostridia bacterium]|nr:hypothetical protein [Clostridia bacterium]
MKETFVNGVPAPWLPVKAKEENKCCTVEIWGRTYTVDKNLLFSSVTTQGVELLASPIRINASENGHKIEWRDIDCFLGECDQKQAIIYATAQSDAFIVNTCMKVEFDGCATIDVKLMPKGYTVPQLFGLESKESTTTLLDYFWIETPVKKELASLYHVYPNDVMPSDTGETDNSVKYSGSGFLDNRNMDLGFCAVAHLGNDDLGLSFLAESPNGWEPESMQKAYQFVEEENAQILRIRLLDKQPYDWEHSEAEKPEFGQYSYPSVCFRLAMQASPVKPFPNNPYKEKLLHIDCFKKVQADYIDFLANPVKEGDTEIGYDRIKRLGVTTLVIHEKWNQTQNYWRLTQRTSHQLRTIIEECHKRGIKVLPYFGYEMSSMSDFWTDHVELYAKKSVDMRKRAVAWYRFPAQRACPVCYASPFAEQWSDGLEKLVDEYNFDGVYLDGTGMVWSCGNANHGCGYTDNDGVRHDTHPVFAVRNLFKRLYDIFNSRGKVINCHISDCVSLPGMAFAHSLWLGEYIQYSLVKEGSTEMPEGYLRASHSGRNFGLPTEFIVYENRPIWKFEDAIAFSLVHGILPRPNDICGPLEQMSEIWKIIDRFDIDSSTWHPYWNNHDFTADNKAVKISGYKDKDGKWLLFIANAETAEIASCTITGFKGTVTDEESGEILTAENGSLTIKMPRFGHRIITVK